MTDEELQWFTHKLENMHTKEWLMAFAAFAELSTAAMDIVRRVADLPTAGLDADAPTAMLVADARKLVQRQRGGKKA
jgi:hypothetical protein